MELDFDLDLDLILAGFGVILAGFGLICFGFWSNRALIALIALTGGKALNPWISLDFLGFLFQAFYEDSIKESTRGSTTSNDLLWTS